MPKTLPDQFLALYERWTQSKPKVNKSTDRLEMAIAWENALKTTFLRETWKVVAQYRAAEENKAKQPTIDDDFKGLEHDKQGGRDGDSRSAAEAEQPTHEWTESTLHPSCYRLLKILDSELQIQKIHFLPRKGHSKPI